MTIKEYREKLKSLSDTQYDYFIARFGGADRPREECVRAFAENPKHERQICYLLGLTTQEERLVNINRMSSFATWLSAGAAFLAISLTAFNLWLSHTTNSKQLALSEKPHVIIQPSERAHGEVGKFQLSITNPGLAHVENVRVYEDYIVCLTPKGGNTTFTRFGIFTTQPNSTIRSLKTGYTEPFVIDFEDTYNEMMNFYHSDVKGQRMCIIRLLIKYIRELDGKEFSQTKAYIIGGSGDILFDNDERGIHLIDEPNFADIKRALGVTSN